MLLQPLVAIPRPSMSTVATVGQVLWLRASPLETLTWDGLALGQNEAVPLTSSARQIYLGKADPPGPAVGASESGPISITESFR